MLTNLTYSFNFAEQILFPHSHDLESNNTNSVVVCSTSDIKLSQNFDQFDCIPGNSELGIANWE